MSASRMGYDLFTHRGWENLIFAVQHRAYKIRISDLWADTFKQVWCWMWGHDKYDSSDMADGSEWACKRCAHYLYK